jgi:mono/diheme cytochrome c family protein
MEMKQTRLNLFSVAVAILLVYSMPASANTERGQLLYENHCTSCHTSTLHVREQRKTKTPAELRAWILRWSGELKLNWSEDELADVYQYLNNQYYKFPVGTSTK